MISSLERLEIIAYLFFQVAIDGAQGLHDKLTLKSTVEFGHFLWDIVIILAKLSLFLQSTNRSVAEVARCPGCCPGEIAIS